MNKIKLFAIYVFAMLLCIAQPNFCMELTQTKTEFKIPDDGQKWTILKTEDDVKAFGYHIVACLIEKEDLLPVNDELFTLNKLRPDDKIGFGYIKPQWLSTKQGYSFYIINCTKETTGYYMLLNNDILKNTSIAIRRLTLQEARSIASSKQFLFQCYEWTHKNTTKYKIVSHNYFKLEHLTPTEQRRYIDKRLEPNKLTLYLIHKFRKNECPLGSLPKDILNMVITRLIDNEVKENQETTLVLQLENNNQSKAGSY